jgi:hypothetical protein
MKGKKQFTVSGPSMDRSVENAGAGLSAASTFANTATREGRDETFYVRNADGETVGFAEADGIGNVTIRRTT